MRLTIYNLFLFIFNTGYLFAVVHRDCGGTIDILREKSGYIRYSSAAGQVDSNSITNSNGKRQLDTECTWIIDALPDQKVQLEVVSIDNVSRLWVHFERSVDQVYVLEESSQIPGIGRTIITWKAKKYAKSQQSINLFFTDWKEMGNSFEGAVGESARTDPAMHTERSSPSISGAPRVRRKSWLLGSSEPTLGSRDSSHHTTGAGGQGLGHGTVGAFHSLTSAPALWLSPSMSAASDKEAPLLTQETSHNNPDTSGAALVVSHIATAPGYLTEGNGGGPDAAGQRLEIRTVETKAEPPRFLNTSTDSSEHVTITLPSTQGLESIFQGQHAERSRDASYHTDPTMGNRQGNVSQISSGQEVTERQSFSDSILTLSSSTLRLSQGWNVLPESEGTAGRRSWSVTDLELLSSLPGDTTFIGTEQGSLVNGTTEMIPGSTGAEHSPRLSSLVTRSLSEGGSSDVPPRDVSEDISPVPGATERSSSTAVLPSLDRLSTEEIGVSVDSADPGSTQSEVASISARVGLDTEAHVTMDSSSPYAATLMPELGDESKTDFTVSAPHSTASTHSSASVDQRFTETLTEKPEFKGSASTGDSSLNSVSVTAVPEVFLWPEHKTNSTHESGSSNSTSHPLIPGDRDEKAVPAVSTAPATIGTQETSDSEDISRAPPAPGTPHHFLKGVTTAAHLLTTSFAQGTRESQGTIGTERPEENTPQSWSDHSESAPASADESTVCSHTLTPSTVGSDISSLSTTTGSPRVAPPIVWPSPVVSSTVRSSVSLSPARSSVTPNTLKGTQNVGCPGCTTMISGRMSSPLVTLNPTVTVTMRSTSISPISTTLQPTAVPLPLTPRPKPTSQAPGHETDLFPAQADLSTSTASTTPATGRVPTIPNPSVKPVRDRIFIMENQPVIIKEETVQLLLQMVLNGSQGEQKSPQPDSIKDDAVQKVEPFLQRAPGYEGLQVSWTSGRSVLQSVPTFNTVRALSWLGAPGGLLNVTGLREAMRQGLYVGGAKVLNITVGGLQPELCSWLFLCPSGFQCVPTGVGNASCTSLCHTDYCKNSGICTHHHGQQPICQCPVGEDFWYMGRRCDFRMTRQRLVGVCLGILLSVAVLMAALSYLAIRRFKAMLVQAKVDQTRSSYRRFNHFDELSGRLWLRSWPGSEDSLDNPAFSRSDELLHLRALDRTCCYHDDTLSIASTCPSSGRHINTVYTHGSHYNWDLSDRSINDWIADSGKASDLSVCSWPIEPIQWTPFPLLQQLGIHRSVKTPRPHSYCEGMELVDLEKTWTA
ncbi:hypothetical protein AAFF_G00080480 [Aldrovandia affinis]|uniref:EGF-like domain-containing protein n=1 Tax=Aldrovandia affinis TaxID=143900 RepID=A0AAD7T4Y8_9TELE|nr:hypothetical protein AAFF_G00080480 [Aldrovandia affinis]